MRVAVPAVNAKWQRLAQFAIAALLVAWLALEVAVTIPQLPGMRTDYARYQDASARVLAGGTFYTAEQVAGPHVTTTEDAIYPPVALGLFLPFYWLPAFLWWAVPLLIIGGVVAYWRPQGWRLVTILGCLAVPQTRDLIILGNPGIWIAAFVALSTRWPWMSAFVLLKPSVFPFGLVGIRDWRWWTVIALLALGTLLTLSWTLDWFHVLLNARGPYSGVLYSLNNVPLLLIPFIAGHGKTAASRSPRRSSLAVAV